MAREPSIVVEKQQGTSIELAIVVTSLLLGVGYRAAVVQGSASTQLVSANTTNLPCPYGPPKPPVRSLMRRRKIKLKL